MKNLNYKPSRSFAYDAANRTFHVSERIAGFDTSYKITNPKTGGEMVFEFSHSTGPEFDPTTAWVYKSYVGGAEHETVELHVHNDAAMTLEAANSYLNAKLSK